MSFLAIVEPAERTNLVLNPSAETTGNYAAHNSATIARVLTGGTRFGIYYYEVTLGGTNRGINLTTATLTGGATHLVTFYSSSTITGVFQVSLDGGSNYTAAAAVNGAAPGWRRYSATIVGAQVSGAALIIRDTLDDTRFVLDGVQVEQASTYSTYIDGDQEGSFIGAYRWNGLRHGSTSLRHPQERGGGVENDLDTTYDIQLLEEYSGLGMPPLTLNYQNIALQPGALFQSHKFQARAIALKLHLEGATFQGLFQRRDMLLDLIKPNRVRGSQPITLAYSGQNTSRKVYGKFRYQSGAEFANPNGYAEEPIVTLVADDPFWVEDDASGGTLNFTANVTNAAYGLWRAHERLVSSDASPWRALGTGFNAYVWKIVTDDVRGRVYFGGSFTTANGVTVNRFTYWNGTTFVAMDSGVNGIVNAIAIAPNGDVWIGGAFTTVGGAAAACKGLARWNLATGTWTAFNPATTTFTSVRSISISPTGNVYVVGDFTNWDAIANADYLAKYDGSVWTALGTGLNGIGQCIEAVSDSLIYVGGDFTTANGVTVNRICYWNGTTFVAMSGGASHSVNALAIDRAGNVFVGGAFTSTPTTTYIAQWTGSQWLALGSGVNAAVGGLALDSSGNLLVGGSFTTAGGLTTTNRVAGWNGTSWFHLDATIPGSAFVSGLAYNDFDDLFIGFDTTGTAASSAYGSPTVTSTTDTYPVLTLVGPSSGSCVLQWVENQSTGEKLYFNLTVQAGETITIDLRPNHKTITSDWRGAINNQPLPNSDFAQFHLLPGENVMAAFISGTTTGVSLAIHYQVTHLSVDGAA